MYRKLGTIYLTGVSDSREKLKGVPVLTHSVKILKKKKCNGLAKPSNHGSWDGQKFQHCQRIKY